MSLQKIKDVGGVQRIAGCGYPQSMRGSRKGLRRVAKNFESSLIVVWFAVTAHGEDSEGRARVFGTMSAVQVNQELAASA